MADDKTTKIPEQPVTDTGPGEEIPPESEKTRLRPRRPKKDGTAGKEPTGVQRQGQGRCPARYCQSPCMRSCQATAARRVASLPDMWICPISSAI